MRISESKFRASAVKKQSAKTAQGDKMQARVKFKCPGG